MGIPRVPIPCKRWNTPRRIGIVGCSKGCTLQLEQYNDSFLISVDSHL